MVATLAVTNFGTKESCMQSAMSNAMSFSRQHRLSMEKNRSHIMTRHGAVGKPITTSIDVSVCLRRAALSQTRSPHDAAFAFCLKQTSLQRFK